MTRHLIFLFPDQLSRNLSALADGDPARDVVVLAETMGECTNAPHHRQKLVFLLSALRHFTTELRAEGYTVRHVALDDPDNAGTLDGELLRAVAELRPTRVIVTEPSEYRQAQLLEAAGLALPVPIEVRPDDRFFCSRADFARWAEGRRSYRMEYFYRDMRRRTGLLMAGEEPVGGQWNFDADNRKPLPADLRIPPAPRFAPDGTTADVLALVERNFPDNFGDLTPFGWAVTRTDALHALDHFISHALPSFGDYQDAMRAGEPFLFHSVLSPYLNAGLLTAAEVCAAAESAFQRGNVPLNAAEGFIRQILGWREYVRGLYWLKMPAYAATNHLNATRPLPWFYWSGDTPMRCVSEVVADTRRNAYAHHIQRLMVTGNFALLAGLDPAQVEEWYLAVYADAFDWVELPNVHGMVLFADGGVLGSKPYAASGAYIDRMSDYCTGCAYSPSIKLGPGACPFNLLYWDFLMRNRAKLAGNPRLAMPYRTLDKMDAARRRQIAAEAAAFLAAMDEGKAQRDLFT